MGSVRNQNLCGAAGLETIYMCRILVLYTTLHSKNGFNFLALP